MRVSSQSGNPGSHTYTTARARARRPQERALFVSFCFSCVTFSFSTQQKGNSGLYFPIKMLIYYVKKVWKHILGEKIEEPPPPDTHTHHHKTGNVSRWRHCRGAFYKMSMLSGGVTCCLGDRWSFSHEWLVSKWALSARLKRIKQTYSEGNFYVMLKKRSFMTFNSCTAPFYPPPPPTFFFPLSPRFPEGSTLVVVVVSYFKKLPKTPSLHLILSYGGYLV